MASLVNMFDPDVAGRAQLTTIGADGEVVDFPGVELFATCQRMACALKSEACVGAILTNTVESVAFVMAAIQSGIRLVSLPLPMRTDDPATWLAGVNATCRTLSVTMLVSEDRYSWMFPPEVVEVPATSLSELAARHSTGEAGVREGFELVQHSSGTTGSPAPLVLSSEKLGANVEAMISMISPESDDVLCSWAPLSHDMGLVGLLAAIAAASRGSATSGSMVLIHPERFVRKPTVWFEALSHYRATATAAPPTSYAVATATTPTMGIDLSSLRCAVVAAELIDPGVLRTVEAKLRPTGFDSRCLSPAYGLAEIGVLASMVPQDEHWIGRSLPNSFGQSAEFVACGHAAPGIELRIHDGEVGEIEVRSESLAQTITGNELPNVQDGWLRTSDLGFISDGQIVPIGRTDDVLIINGRNVVAGPVEAHLCDVAQVRLGTVAVIVSHGGYHLITEAPRTGTASSSADTVLAHECYVMLGQRPKSIVTVPRGSLPRTLSGKLRRARLVEAWAAGTVEILEERS